METFGFTRKKFMKLSARNRHKKVMAWLLTVYQKAACNRLSPSSIERINLQYREILAWSDSRKFDLPETSDTRIWLESISDRIHFHRCEAGLVCRDHDLMHAVQTADLALELEPDRLDCHMALDGLRSVFNIGAVFRTCEAAGFISVILGNTPGKEHNGVQKTAMGTHEWINQEKTKDLAGTLLEKKELGYTIIGLETVEGAVSYDEYPWKEKTIIVLGNEEYGIASHVLKTCDACVKIPMFGKKNSINVAGAAAVVCFNAALAIKSAR